MKRRRCRFAVAVLGRLHGYPNLANALKKVSGSEPCIGLKLRRRSNASAQKADLDCFHNGAARVQ